MGDKAAEPIWAEDCKSFRFDELGAEGDDTWLGGGAPRRKGIPKRETDPPTNRHGPIASIYFNESNGAM